MMLLLLIIRITVIVHVGTENLKNTCDLVVKWIVVCFCYYYYPVAVYFHVCMFFCVRVCACVCVCVHVHMYVFWFSVWIGSTCTRHWSSCHWCHAINILQTSNHRYVFTCTFMQMNIHKQTHVHNIDSLTEHLILYLERVAQAAPSLPMYYYHIPSCTGVNCKWTG